MTTLCKLSEVIALTRKTKSPLYADIKSGVFPRPVKLGLRSAAWPVDEVEAINRARIAGATDEQLRDLVTRLHAKREGMLKEVLHA